MPKPKNDLPSGKSTENMCRVSDILGHGHWICGRLKGVPAHPGPWHPAHHSFRNCSPAKAQKLLPESTCANHVLGVSVCEAQALRRCLFVVARSALFTALFGCQAALSETISAPTDAAKKSLTELKKVRCLKKETSPCKPIRLQQQHNHHQQRARANKICCFLTRQHLTFTPKKATVDQRVHAQIMRTKNSSKLTCRKQTQAEPSAHNLRHTWAENVREAHKVTASCVCQLLHSLHRGRTKEGWSRLRALPDLGQAQVQSRRMAHANLVPCCPPQNPVSPPEAPRAS